MEGKATLDAKNTKELAVLGQKCLEDTIEAAYRILSVMKEELCNPLLWSPSHLSNGVAAGSSHHMEMSVGALEDARLRYKKAVASLRAVLTAIPNSVKVKSQESVDVLDQTEADKLEDQLTNLKKELVYKNKYLKQLIDQLRDLITVISTWQSPV